MTFHTSTHEIFNKDYHSSCMRCGTCCKKGGPSLHEEDIFLIEGGKIGLRYLYTIRKGEMAYDNVQRRLIPVTSDIIKIKGQQTSWMCIFFDEQSTSCFIYENRPLECRTLNCRDTKKIEEIYSKTRLSREALLHAIDGLWELVKDHQNKCSYDILLDLIEQSSHGNNQGSARNKILEMIDYDETIRKLTVSKGRLDPEITDFLFGRPLKQTLKPFSAACNISIL